MRQNIYTPIQQVRDVQPIRATCFHPSGETYVVGTNSKALKICKYPDRQRIQALMSEDGPEDGIICEPELSFTCLHIHRASVYCATFNGQGDMLATGSNDQIVHIIKYNKIRHAPEGGEFKLSLHNGTVRDVCFLPTNDTARSLLLSAGGRDYEINMTDCAIMKPKQIFQGHKSTVMSLHHCQESENMFVSGSLDGSIKVWDIRCRDPVSEVANRSMSLRTLSIDGDCGCNISFNSSNQEAQQQQQQDSKNQRPAIAHLVESDQKPPISSTATSTPNQGTGQGVPVGVVRLDQTGRLLASGHQDGSCMLYDIRAGCIIQLFKAHDDEIRTLNFSPRSYYLLSGGYDCKVRLTDLQGQLNNPLPGVEVLEQNDKIVQTAWHPEDYNFVTTCADGSATLWTIADFDEWRRDSLLVDF